jgi:glycosyltransferase involved in cell wall biosynthesis
VRSAAEFFDPCIDPRVFRRYGRPGGCSIGSNLLFCYARPGHPRNCFELLAAAMRLAKKELGDRVQIITAGAEWDPSQFGLDEVVENLGVLSYANTGALYRACDAGVALMMTSHPSYLPFELMACGALAIANRNPDTSWFLRDRENCLLADASPTCLAETVVEGMRNRSLRESISQNAAALIEDRYSDWDSQAEKIYGYMCAHL